MFYLWNKTPTCAFISFGIRLTSVSQHLGRFARILLNIGRWRLHVCAQIHFLIAHFPAEITEGTLPPNTLINALVDNSNENYTMQNKPVNIYNLRRVTKTAETIDSCQARWASHGITAVGMRYFLVSNHPVWI